MSATKNQECIIPENGKLIDKNACSQAEMPKEAINNSVKDMMMMNSESPLRHSTSFKPMETPQKKLSSLGNYRQRVSSFERAEGQYHPFISQERRLQQSPFRNYASDTREDNKEEQVIPLQNDDLRCHRQRNNNNNNSIQNTPLTVFNKNHKSKDEDDNQYNNFSTGFYLSPYRGFSNLCKQSQGAHYYSKGRSPISGVSSNILQKGSSPFVDRVRNRTNNIQQSNICYDDLKRQLNFYDSSKFEPNREIDLGFQSPYVRNQNKQAGDEMTPYRQKSPIKSFEFQQNKLHGYNNNQQWGYQQFYPMTYDGRVQMMNNCQNSVPYYGGPLAPIQQEYYEVTTKKDSNQICIFRSNSTKMQDGNENRAPAQSHSFEEQATFNKQLSTKKNSFFSTGKKTKKRQSTNSQYLTRNPMQIQNQNGPSRVHIRQFVKLSPYPHQQRFNHSNYENSNNVSDPLYYRNSSLYQASQTSMNQSILKKQPTFGHQVSQFTECIPQSFNYNSKHHHHHHYHHHFGNEYQDSNQYFYSEYLDQANPPLEAQRKIQQQRKQQSIINSRYNNRRMMKSGGNEQYNQQNNLKQMTKRYQQEVQVILPTTIEKPEKQQSGKKVLGIDKQNIVSNQLQINNNDQGAAILSQSNDGDTFKPCSCSRSKCLKKYCECFSAGRYCRKQCNCCGCMNNVQFQDKRQDALLKQKDGDHEKIGRVQGKIQHLKGCTCKKSNCIKNYCECFQFNIPCGDLCKCVCCKNTPEERKLRIHNSVAPVAFQQAKLEQQQYFNNYQEDRVYRMNSFNNDQNQDLVEMNNNNNNFCEFTNNQGSKVMNNQLQEQGKYTFGNISASQNQNASPNISKPGQEQAAISKNSYSVESKVSLQRNGVKGSGILSTKEAQSHECTEFTPSPFKKSQNEWSSIKKKNQNIGARKSKQMNANDEDDEYDEQIQEQLQEQEVDHQQQDIDQDNEQLMHEPNIQDSNKNQGHKQKSSHKAVNQLGQTINIPQSDKNNNILSINNSIIKKKKVGNSGNSSSFSSTSALNSSSRGGGGGGSKSSQNKRNVNKSLFDQKKLMINIENSIINTDLKKCRKRIKRSGEKMEDDGGLLEQTKKPQLRKKSQRISQKLMKAQQ